MEATFFIKGVRKDLSEAQASVHNPETTFTPYNYLLTKEPDFFVYLYSISEQAFKVSRPPVFREMTIPGKSGAGLDSSKFAKLKEEGKVTSKWILATKLPSPVVTPKSNPDSDQFDFDAINGLRFVMDIINPDNTGIDQDAVIDTKVATSQGNNLGSKGVFYSRTFPPSEAEVASAEKRLDAFYAKKLEEARAVEVSDPKNLQNILGPEHHAAADHFGEEFSWHGKKIKAVVCDLCGERTRENAAFHKMDDGGLCIKDWDRAIKAGVRTRAQAYEATENEKYAPRVAPTAPAPPQPAAPTEKV